VLEGTGCCTGSSSSEESESDEKTIFCFSVVGFSLDVEAVSKTRFFTEDWTPFAGGETSLLSDEELGAAVAVAGNFFTDLTPAFEFRAEAEMDFFAVFSPSEESESDEETIFCLSVVGFSLDVEAVSKTRFFTEDWTPLAGGETSSLSDEELDAAFPVAGNIFTDFTPAFKFRAEAEVDLFAGSSSFSEESESDEETIFCFSFDFDAALVSKTTFLTEDWTPFAGTELSSSSDEISEELTAGFPFAGNFPPVLPSAFEFLAGTEVDFFAGSSSLEESESDEEMIFCSTAFAFSFDFDASLVPEPRLLTEDWLPFAGRATSSSSDELSEELAAAFHVAGNRLADLSPIFKFFEGTEEFFFAGISFSEESASEEATFFC
jgi:hypothetical protein